ncbi:MAG TPA: ribonuclease R [Vicinamibacterales bacterium]|nr:ribonuclease R [Vicinamibacterales bacterium]
MRSPDELLRLIRETVHHPATARELTQLLRVPREARAAFKRQLKAMVSSGDLLQIRGNRFGLPDKMDLVVGRLTTNPAGFGFVVPEEGKRGEREDIYIAASNLTEAMHGDRVVARIERRTDKGAEGRIIRILERSQANLVGRFEIDEAGLGYVAPFDRRVLTDVHVPTGQWSSAEPGDMVVVEMTRWPTATRGPVGRVIEVLGRIDEPGVDTQIIIRKFNIPDTHPEEAIDEARRIGGVVKERDIKGRTDFRGVTTVTIDGEHARDFDDAITIERLKNGHYWLGVHIADVSHYVKEGSALDEEAYERGTSVYFTERAVHMFPAELATGLCSLNPRVDRLVQSCFMEVDSRGQVVRYEIHDGVINSDARMTYMAVNAILTDHDEATTREYQALVPMFEQMHELFGILNLRRRRRGSIDFDLPEAEVILSDVGQITDIVASERNVAHRLIEEFMLLANETVAAHLVTTDVPALHRVHEPPDLKKVADFEAFITTLGYSLAATGQSITPTHFQKLIDRMKGTPEERPIAALMLRTMQKARYDAASLGHFGLAAEHYTHFTSPIRRYPDLVVHRMLRESRQAVMSPARRDELNEELPETAKHTSEMERRADEAERELLQWKKVRFMADKVGDEYEGYITGVAPFGLFIELVEHYVEGLVHISSMADDYYRFVEQQHILQGENTKKAYRLGDKVLVQVVRVDMERRQVDLGLVDILETIRRDERMRGPHRSTIRTKKQQRLKQRPGRNERQAKKQGRGAGRGRRR